MYWTHALGRPTVTCAARVWCRQPHRETEMPIVARTIRTRLRTILGSARWEGDCLSRPTRCSDARSMGWTGDHGPSVRRRDEQADATVAPVADERDRRSAARQFRIGLAVTFMALASGLATAAAADEKQGGWQRPSARGPALAAPGASADYWALCRRSYHVAPGEYWPCPPVELGARPTTEVSSRSARRTETTRTKQYDRLPRRLGMYEHRYR